MNMKELWIDPAEDLHTILTKESKQMLQACQSEHSVEIRQSKRKQILKKIRKDQEEEGNKQIIDYPSIRPDLIAYCKTQTNDEFQEFMRQVLPLTIQDSTLQEKIEYVQILISIIMNPTCSLFMQGAAAKELSSYFFDQDPSVQIKIKDVYKFIEILIQSNYPAHAANILCRWKEVLISESKTQQEKDQLIGCLLLIKSISRGSESHCMTLEDAGILPTIFDIFDATKTKRDLAEIVIFIIGNLIPASSTWRVYFMGRNFHNIILSYLKFAPKNPENLVLHRLICWCIASLSRDYFEAVSSRGYQLPTSERANEASKFDNAIFDFSHISNLCETYAAYDDIEIRSDIAWAFPQLISIFFYESKKEAAQSHHPTNLTSDQEIIYKELVSRKIAFLLENGFYDFIIIALPTSEMTILTPVLRCINRIMQGQSEILNVFFGQCYSTIKINLQKNLQHRMKMVRKEVIQTLHHMLKSDAQNYLALMVEDFLPITLSRILIDDISIKEQIFKLLSYSIEILNEDQFYHTVFYQQVAFFQSLKATLFSYETKIEGILVIISLLIKILKYVEHLSHKKDQRVKMIISQINANSIPQFIEQLQEHPQGGVYSLALSFVELFNNITDTLEEQFGNNGIQIETSSQANSNTQQQYQKI